MVALDLAPIGAMSTPTVNLLYEARFSLYEIILKFHI